MRKTQHLRPTCDLHFLHWNQYVKLLVAFWGVLFLAWWKISPHIVSDLGRGCRPRLHRPLQPPSSPATSHTHACTPPPLHAAVLEGRGSAMIGDATTTSRGKQEGHAATRGDNMTSSQRIKSRCHVKRQGHDERSHNNQPRQS